MADAVFTTSWDDGHPLDMRLAEMLARHGVGGTFYVPITNSEGRPTMDAGQLRELAAGGFEIGSHTHDHVRLHGLPEAAAIDQMLRGKHELEQRLGRAVTGFCPPGGRGVALVRKVAGRLGITHARTVEMFRLDPGGDPFARPTSLQVHAHGAPPLLRNWARQGMGAGRLALCLGCIRRPDLEARLSWLMDRACERGGLLHVWGHSWELEQAGLWPQLDRILARAAQAFPRSARLCNADAFAGRPPCAS